MCASCFFINLSVKRAAIGALGALGGAVSNLFLTHIKKREITDTVRVVISCWFSKISLTHPRAGSRSYEAHPAGWMIGIGCGLDREP